MEHPISEQDVKRFMIMPATKQKLGGTIDGDRANKDLTVNFNEWPDSGGRDHSKQNHGSPNSRSNKQMMQTQKQYN